MAEQFLMKILGGQDSILHGHGGGRQLGMGAQSPGHLLLLCINYTPAIGVDTCVSR